MPASPLTSRVAPEERLVNLVVALMATDHGLTKETILESVAGYREQRDGGASRDALEKMFERDKESLRAQGVPISTLGDFADPDDLREARYLIPTAEYALDGVEFSAAEIGLLTLAGQVWGRSSLSDDARQALQKIRSLGNHVDEAIIGFAPRVTIRDAAFAPLEAAIETTRVVQFDYLKPGDMNPRRRRVRPLALVEYESRWHLYADDLDMEAERTFLLSRIVGPVVLLRDTFDPGLRTGAGERALAGLREVAERNVAVVWVDPGSEAELRLRRRATPDGADLRVPFVDIHVFADELASYGPEAVVHEPAALRDAVVARLTVTRDLNEDAR